MGDFTNLLKVVSNDFNSVFSTNVSNDLHAPLLPYFVMKHSICNFFTSHCLFRCPKNLFKKSFKQGRCCLKFFLCIWQAFINGFIFKNHGCVTFPRIFHAIQFSCASSSSSLFQLPACCLSVSPFVSCSVFLFVCLPVIVFFRFIIGSLTFCYVPY